MIILTEKFLLSRIVILWLVVVSECDAYASLSFIKGSFENMNDQVADSDRNS